MRLPLRWREPCHSRRRFQPPRLHLRYHRRLLRAQKKLVPGRLRRRFRLPRRCIPFPAFRRCQRHLRPLHRAARISPPFHRLRQLRRLGILPTAEPTLGRVQSTFRGQAKYSRSPAYRVRLFPAFRKTSHRSQASLRPSPLWARFPPRLPRYLWSTRRNLRRNQPSLFPSLLRQRQLQKAGPISPTRENLRTQARLQNFRR